MKSPLTHHPFTQLLTLIIIMLFSLIILSFIGLLIAIPLFDLSIQQIFQELDAATLNQNIALFKYLQSIQTIGLFVIPPFLFAWLYSKNPAEYLKIDVSPDVGTAFYVILVIFLGIPFIGYLGELNQSLELPEALKGVEKWLTERETNAQRITEKFLTAETRRDLLFNILMIGVLPAVGEEFIFRGVIQRVLQRWVKNVHWAIFISAFAFSAMHIQFYGFLPRLFLGILFGYFLVWGKSVWLPVLAHFVNNTTAVVYYYFYQQNEQLSQTDFTGYDMPIIVVLFSLGSILLFCYLIYTNEKRLEQ